MKNYSLFLLPVIALLSFQCSEENEAELPGEKTYAVSSRVESPGGAVNVQDVYNFSFAKGAKVTFAVTDIINLGQVQVALYAPNTELGSTNLFTGDETEAGCMVDNCNLGTAGITVSDFTIPASGNYRFVITRNWAWSCGSLVDFTLNITSDKNFEFKEQSVDNGVSAAPETPSCISE
jgi:hypothetical protein